MAITIKMNMRGTVTLPRKLRERFLLKGENLLIAEETKNGILLKPSIALPIETYSADRLEEFERNNNQAIRKVLKARRKRT